MSTIEAGKNPRDIILKPVVTEKSSVLMDQGKYTFEVDPRATKTEIK
ncbi:MAG: 50S ribosomal protein L23, partial [Propionibacterium sp.]|nr:50S ribosomal protein L23 [Propionibacterium sp.]